MISSPRIILSWRTFLKVMLSVSVMFSLLLGCCGEQETTHHTSKEQKATNRMPASPKKCLEDIDCDNTVLLKCDLETEFCTCRDINSVLFERDRCLTGKLLGEACESAAQCRMLEHNSTCSEEKLCVCESGFHRPRNETLCSPSEVSGSSRPVDIKMVVILVSLCVMFIGICLVLRLFSKARFWKKRNIFSALRPRFLNLKLGRKRRKSSIHSHDLPHSPDSSTENRHPSTEYRPPSGEHRRPSLAGHHTPHAGSNAHAHESLTSPVSPPHFEPMPKKQDKESLLLNDDHKKSTLQTLQDDAPSRMEPQHEAFRKTTVVITDH